MATFEDFVKDMVIVTLSRIIVLYMFTRGVPANGRVGLEIGQCKEDFTIRTLHNAHHNSNVGVEFESDVALEVACEWGR